MLNKKKYICSFIDTCGKKCDNKVHIRIGGETTNKFTCYDHLHELINQHLHRTFTPQRFKLKHIPHYQLCFVNMNHETLYTDTKRVYHRTSRMLKDNDQYHLRF